MKKFLYLKCLFMHSLKIDIYLHVCIFIPFSNIWTDLRGTSLGIIIFSKPDHVYNFWFSDSHFFPMIQLENWFQTNINEKKRKGSDLHRSKLFKEIYKQAHPRQFFFNFFKITFINLSHLEKSPRILKYRAGSEILAYST